MPPIVLKFDVADALPAEVSGGRPLHIAARVFPPAAPRAGRQTVLTCIHGGSYDWRYWHLEVPGHPGYSLVEHMAARGHLVVAIDQLGVGESGRPAAPRLAGRDVVAAATHAAMGQLYAGLADGGLHPALPRCAEPLKVGIGHSMGGMTVVTEQAAFATYDLLAVLGHSNRGAYIETGGQLIKNTAPFDEAGPDYKSLDRDRVMRSFHWETTPEAVLAVDAANAVQYPALLGWQAQQGSTELDAGRIATPVFLVMGERDVSPDPYAEPAYYSASPDITFMFLRESAHCHNFAPSRHRLWNRLDRWIDSLAEG